MKYTISITKKAQKSLSKIDEPHRSKIIKKLYQLEEDPLYNSKKLTGRDAFRIRVGNYRVIYEIHDGELVVLVINISHRKDVYL